jgi:uncharacterized membrane protein
MRSPSPGSRGSVPGLLLLLWLGCTTPAATESVQPSGLAAIDGVAYEPARRFVNSYCAPCHARGGPLPDHMRAYQVLHLDSYQDWKAGKRIILAVIDRWHLDGKIMPPPTAPAQPTDDERLQMIDWTQRDAPNSADGQ